MLAKIITTHKFSLFFLEEVASLKSSQVNQKKKLIDADTSSPELIKVKYKLKEDAARKSVMSH